MAEQERATPGTEVGARPGPRPERPERSVTQLFLDLSRETADLIEKEVRLMRAETSQKINQVTAGIMELITGAVITFAGLLVLLYAVVALLDKILQPWPQAGWVSPLIVGVVVTIIGGIAFAKGRSNLEARNLVPQRSARSLRRDQQMVKEQMR